MLPSRESSSTEGGPNERSAGGPGQVVKSTQAVSDLRLRGLFSFLKEQSALDLGLRDTVLRSQIFVPQQQFLIDGAGDVGQHASPNHFLPLWLIELKRSWIVVLIEAVEKAIRRDSSRLQAPPFQTGRIS